MPAYTKISGAWKTVNSEYDCYIKVSGSWKKCDQVYVKVNGAWKPCFPKIRLEYTSNWGIIHRDDGRNYLSNVQVGSVITICFNAYVWISAGDDGVQGTVLRNSMFVKAYGAYASGNNVWLYNQNNYGDLYYIDIDRRYQKWVSLQYTATSSNPSFEITWPRQGSSYSRLSQWGFNIRDDRIEYTRETRL